MRREILYVDKDTDDQQRFSSAIASVEGLNATITSSASEAITSLKDKQFDIVVTEADIEGDIDDLFDAIEANERRIPCIVFSNHEIEDLVEENILLRASAYMKKDDDEGFERLIDQIREALRPRSEINYPVPEDESERLQALEDLHLKRLQNEDAFDRLTKIAKAFFGVKFAFVGVVQEDVEKFISFEGDNVDELARECSICTFGILSEDTTVIDDSQADERFKYIDELRDLDIIFYAGHPLVGKNGHRIGMFCIADDEPREFSAEKRKYLKLFAEQASELINLYEREEA